MPASTLGVSPIGSQALGATVASGAVTVTVTAPTGIVTVSPFTVTWTYTNSGSALQQSYRVRLLSDAGVQLYDSGTVTSSAKRRSDGQFPHQVVHANCIVHTRTNAATLKHAVA